ncbi:MAG: hypothetical protein WC455_30215 [Dehalococcoidia bacterium]|jgi:hypothetical protein
MDAGKVVSLAIYILTALVVIALFCLICRGAITFILANYNVVTP